jgi:threonine aldolase
MRFLAVQFQAYFNNDLWRKNAEHSNRMAQLLYESVKRLAQMKVVYPVQANAVFAQLPRRIWQQLQQQYFFYEWDEQQDIVRWMCSFDTTEADIAAFADTLEKIITDNNI